MGHVTWEPSVNNLLFDSLLSFKSFKVSKSDSLSKNNGTFYVIYAAHPPQTGPKFNLKNLFFPD